MNRNHVTAAGAAEPEQHPSQSLELAIRRQMLGLSFYGFERCVSKLLRSLGYESARIRRSGKGGRNRDGGWDIEATIQTGLVQVKTILQVKQYDTVSVQKRYVDELRGSMLRTASGQGILVTLSTFSDPAREAADAGTIAPVRLIDGTELSRLMIRHRIGVVETADNGASLDLAFFERLARSASSGDVPRAKPACPDSAAAHASPVTIVVIGSSQPPTIQLIDKR